MDLELLRIQAEDAFDDRGHVIGLYGITIACAEDRQELWIGAEVPNPLAAALTATFDGSRLDGAPSSASPGEPPPALERCRHLLKTGERALHRSGGPSFLIGRDTHFVSELHIERSDTSTGKALRAVISRAQPALVR